MANQAREQMDYGDPSNEWDTQNPQSTSFSLANDLPDFNMSYDPTARLAVLPVANAAGETLGELLGRIRRKRKAKKHHKRHNAAANQKAIKTAVRDFGQNATPEQKADALKKLAKKLPKHKRRRLALLALRKKLRLARAARRVKNAIKSSPVLKAKILTAVVRRKALQAVANSKFDPTNPDQVPQLPNPVAAPSQPPADPAILEDKNPSTADAIQAEEESEALDSAQDSETQTEKATDEAENETVNDAEASEEATEDAEDQSLTEPTDAEASEEASEEVDADTTEGESIMGAAILGIAKKHARHAKVRAAARPIANAIHKKTKGKVKASDTMKGCALIQAAKGGNVKAKAVIKSMESRAAKGDKKAKKTLAHLKLCGAVIKKARKVVKKKMATPKRKAGKKVNVYTTRVPLVSEGLNSFSAHQRGLSMIPAFARAQFKSVG